MLILTSDKFQVTILLMYVYEIIKWQGFLHKILPLCFLPKFVQFSTCKYLRRWFITKVLQTWQNFYFHHLSRLWNSFPNIDLSLLIQVIEQNLYNFNWELFLNSFVNTNVHSFHYKCPCSHCVTASMAPLYRDLTRLNHIFMHASIFIHYWYFLKSLAVLASWLSVYLFSY